MEVRDNYFLIETLHFSPGLNNTTSLRILSFSLRCFRMDLSYLYFPFGITKIINVINIIKQINVTTGVLFIAILTTFFSYKKKRPKHRHIKLDNEFVKPLVIFYSLHPSPFNGKNRDAPV